MYTHILIPTDGSELAQQGVSHGLSLARKLGSRVTVLTVTEPFPIAGFGEGWVPSPSELENYLAESAQRANELLEKVKAEAGKLGVSADTEYVSERHAATAIVEAVERLGCNLIVMSSHGRRGISRLLLGSQTAEVLANSPVPVLVIR